MLWRLKEENIHITVETALFVPRKNVLEILETVDLIYVDIKIVEKKRCTEMVHGDLTRYLENLDLVLHWTDREGRRKPVIARIPVIGGYTDSEENRGKIVELLSGYKNEGCEPLKIEIMKGHNLGVEKYHTLGYESPQFEDIPDVLLEKYKEELEILGIPIEVLRL